MRMFRFLLSPKGRVTRFHFVYTWCAVLLFTSMVSVFIQNSLLLWFAPIAVWPITVKRLHDVNLDSIYSVIIYQVYGLFLLKFLGLNSVEFMNYTISMTTLIYYMLWPSALCIIYLMLQKGQEGVNEFGNDPMWMLNPRVQLEEFMSWKESK